MQSNRIHQDQSPQALRLIDMIKSGDVVRVARLTIEPVETPLGWSMQTVAMAIQAKGNAAFPVAVIDHHPTDDDAMRYAVDVFETLKSLGHISSNQAAQYRRGLITLVPPDHQVI
ncbi:hypothetical protein Q1Z72_01540 [Pseudomonas qingdaonensis]|uniref:hypothetical protein n=1 Tax=Pseudomonas TaxID=286 RepID=UPI0021C003F3|nr:MULTISPECIES: hypothetical protein [Pseudomonas]UXH55918.1 hypothetical protein N5876_32745 [Pseudomonas aeruginosa]UXH68962.1 hypothetical protein N5879_32870 [Pseudomonas aeruginosa]WKL67378.1 hypothetical protein Q1Z72_01540 [Pseudomonas qingdaonensis]